MQKVVLFALVCVAAFADAADQPVFIVGLNQEKESVRKELIRGLTSKRDYYRETAIATRMTSFPEPLT